MQEVTKINLGDNLSYVEDHTTHTVWFERAIPGESAPRKFVVRENIGIIRQLAITVNGQRLLYADLKDEYAEYRESVTGINENDETSVENEIVNNVQLDDSPEFEMNFDGPIMYPVAELKPVIDPSAIELPDPNDPDA